MKTESEINTQHRILFFESMRTLKGIRITKRARNDFNTAWDALYRCYLIPEQEEAKSATREALS